MAFAFAVAAPLAAAETLDAGPLHLVVDRDPPGPCASVAGAPCLLAYSDGGSAGIGDDEVRMPQHVRAVAVALEAPVGRPMGTSTDLRNGSVPLSAIPFLSGLDRQTDAVTPQSVAENFDVDLEGDGIHLHTWEYNPDGQREEFHSVILWEDDLFNYTSVHVPYKTWDWSSDYFLTLPEFRCPGDFLIGRGPTCLINAPGALLLRAQDHLPNVVAGAEVHRAEAGVVPASGSSDLVVGQAALDAPRSEVGRPGTSSGPPPVFPGVGERGGPRPSADWALADLPPTAQEGSSTASVPFQAHERLDALLLAALALPLLAALLYHRLRAQRVVDHPHRRSIQAFLAADPGADVARIAAHHGLDYKTTAHHIEVLRRLGLVRVVRLAARTVVFLTGAEREAITAAATRHATRQRVVWLVQSEPGIRQARVARRLGVGRSTLHAHVRVLVEARLVENRRGRLFPAEPAAPPAQGADAPGTLPA